MSEDGSARSARPMREIPTDPGELQDLSEREAWGDGLPLVPPTPERVRDLVSASGLDSVESLGAVPPSWRDATVEVVAASAVMAGCAPRHFPAVVAAVCAMTRPGFNLRGIQSTTNSVAVGVMVNGPARQWMGINSGQGCLGPGWRANATIGRAVRLVLLTVGGGDPRTADGATHGCSMKYTACFGENEEASPWAPFHVDHGFDAAASTATVFGLSGSLSVIESTPVAAELVRTIGTSLHYAGSNDYVYDGEPVVVLGSEHARILADAGMTKRDVQGALFEASFAPLSRFSDTMVEYQVSARSAVFVERDGEPWVPASASAEGIQVIVAGGPSIHTTLLPTYGVTRCESQEIYSNDFAS